MLKSCHIRAMTEGDLGMVLDWRNNPDVRRYMYSQHDIEEEEHYKWFSDATADVSRRQLIVMEAMNAIGYVHFNDVSEGGVANWGFYARPGAAKGTGKKLSIVALNYAFNELNLYKVCGQVLATNTTSIALHQKLGFTLEGVLRAQKRINKINIDIHCFGMLAVEWNPENCCK